MDSKMECMRALLGREPQSESLFTPWSSALERVALRKDRYLSTLKPAPETTPEAAAPVSETSLAAGPGVVDPVTTASAEPLNAASAADVNAAAAAASTNGSSPSISGRGAPAQPKPKTAPASNSIFGEKLQQALNDERK
jgi:hypothetical protein